jgi:energy-coupling factor transporter ATP-binding protein EcfA2
VTAEIEFNNASFTYPEGESPVFNGLNLELPRGVVTFIGQNGTGKSTALLMAAGIARPESGDVKIKGISTSQLRDETERHRYVSFIYQNMEFETEDPIGDVLEFVYQSGHHDKKSRDFLKDITRQFELEQVLSRKTQDVSKGELQRTILAFTLLYGSQILIMDEPVFALEQKQKEAMMSYLAEYVRSHDMSLYFSAHELELSRSCADFALLFYRDKAPLLGPVAMIFEDEVLEEAYGIPVSYLKRKESLYRNMLSG